MNSSDKYPMQGNSSTAAGKLYCRQDSCSSSAQVWLRIRGERGIYVAKHNSGPRRTWKPNQNLGGPLDW